MGPAVNLHGNILEPPMSALGQKRTWRDQIAMSALHSIADIHCGNRNVCFGPLGDIVALRSAINQDFIDLFGEQGSVLVSYL